mmetsp:Transcript_20825/g.18213  ORF Transcript_20825/g.18213 Transcript_20825/m.18213 type:complete len:80 (+) Transcript_20825:288-527(+)
MIENLDGHIENLMNLMVELADKMWAMDDAYCTEILRYFLVNSCVHDFKPVLEKFISFAKNDFNPYSFIELSKDPHENYL